MRIRGLDQLLENKTLGITECLGRGVEGMMLITNNHQEYKTWKSGLKIDKLS